MENYYQSFSFYLNIILFLIIIVLIIFNRSYENELNLFDLIKIYEIGENDLISSQIRIRKNDGQTCQITTEFPNQGKLSEYHEKKDKIMDDLDNDNITEDEGKKLLEDLGGPLLVKNVIKKGDCI